MRIATLLRGAATLVLAVALEPGAASAAVVGGANVPALLQASDLVVVGQAAQVRIDAITGTELLLVSVNRTIKGAASVVHVRLDLSEETAAPVAAGQSGIFFLQARNGSYTATDPGHPLLASGASSRTRNGDALTEIADELVGALTTPDHGDEIAIEAAAALMTIPAAKSIDALRSAVDAGDQAARIWAVACLLSLADSESAKIEYLAAVEPILLTPSPSTRVAISALAGNLAGSLQSEGAVPTLRALSKSRQADLRAAATQTLAALSTTSD
jgi:hypothetical protein